MLPLTTIVNVAEENYYLTLELKSSIAE